MLRRSILCGYTCPSSVYGATCVRPSQFSADVVVLPKRWKVKEKWSAYRRPETNSDRALKYFDSYYASVFGPEKWASMRLALLCRKSYCAVVNQYNSNLKEAVIDLIEMGCDLLPPDASLFPAKQCDTKISDDSELREKSLPKLTDLTKTEFSFETPPKNQGLESFIPPPSVETPSDERRKSEEQLFVGSEHTDADDNFRVLTDSWSSPVSDMFPACLQAFAFPSTEVSKFPEPKTGLNGLLAYYLMDLASVFTVLALNPQSNERILDLCAAPGGKSLVIMQCCTPRQLVCVDKSPSRSKRLQNTLAAYLPPSVLRDTVEVFPGCDAISFADNHCGSHRHRSEKEVGFDKVLVDVPCLNDRISVADDENNWFKPSRNKERLSLPETQRDILVAALRCCAVGGVVVYSTCTLAPGQNDGVIFSALQMAAEQFNIEAVVEKPHPFVQFITHRRLLNIDPSWSRFGYLVAPILTANFGPSFCCRIKRTA